MLKSLTSTFLNPNLNHRQVSRHILQHTHFSNQVAKGRKRAEVVQRSYNQTTIKKQNKQTKKRKRKLLVFVN